MTNLAIATPVPTEDQDQRLRTQYAAGINAVKAKLDRALQFAEQGVALEMENAIRQLTPDDLAPVFQAITELKSLERRRAQRRLHQAQEAAAAASQDLELLGG